MNILLRLAGAVLDLLGEILRLMLGQTAPQGYGNYRAPWRWDARRRRWVYGGSEGAGQKSYQCSEYVVARIEGRGPRWGPDDTTTTEPEEIEAKLAELNWIRREGGCNCGCGEGQNRDCVVVYKDNGTVVHVAIFDHVHCDWGGKLNAGLPIARFRRPEHYFEGGTVPEGCEMVFYCPRRAGEAGGPAGTLPPNGQPTDEWIHDNASAQ